MERVPLDCDRPKFECHSCGRNWTNGKDGGTHADYCAAREKGRKTNEPHYIIDVGPYEVAAEVFESIRRSIDTLPVDGNKLALDASDFAMLELCAMSHEAAKFAKHYARYTGNGRILKINKKNHKV
jgi:hypothetical protein